MSDNPKLINDVLEQLAAMGVSKAERSRAAQPIVDMALHDILHNFQNLVVQYASEENRRTQGEIAGLHIRLHNIMQNRETLTLADTLSRMTACVELRSDGDRKMFAELSDTLVVLHSKLRDDLVLLPRLSDFFAPMNTIGAIRAAYGPPPSNE